MINNIKKLYTSLSAHLKNNTIICDSSHRSTQAKLLWLYYRNRLKIIHLVRDGRGVSNSVMNRTNCSIREASTAWKRNNIFTLLTLSGISKENILRIRYEDLCKRTENELKKITQFVGIDFLMKDFILDKTKYHFIGGSSSIKNINVEEIRLDEKWKLQLSEKDKKIFSKIAGNINSFYHYN